MAKRSALLLGAGSCGCFPVVGPEPSLVQGPLVFSGLVVATLILTGVGIVLLGAFSVSLLAKGDRAPRALALARDVVLIWGGAVAVGFTIIGSVLEHVLVATLRWGTFGAGAVITLSAIIGVLGGSAVAGPVGVALFVAFHDPRAITLVVLPCIIGTMARFVLLFVLGRIEARYSRRRRTREA